MKAVNQQNQSFNFFELPCKIRESWTYLRDCSIGYWLCSTTTEISIFKIRLYIYSFNMKPILSTCYTIRNFPFPKRSHFQQRLKISAHFSFFSWGHINFKQHNSLNLTWNFSFHCKNGSIHNMRFNIVQTLTVCILWILTEKFIDGIFHLSQNQRE